MANVRVNIRSLKQSVEGFRSLARVPSHPAFEAMFTQWGTRYSGFSRRRYVQNAAGGGDWAPLALSTIKARTKGKGTGRTRRGGGRTSARTSLARDTRRGSLVASPRAVQILRDTGALLNTLTIGAPGNALTRSPGAVTFSVGTSGELKTIARAHQDGNPRTRMPARRILVQPDAQTLSGMRSDAVRAVQRMSRGGGA